MNRYVNDNFGYITICGYICCLYRSDSFASGSYVSQSTERKKIVRAVSDVLYIWKFLYYKYCICGSAASYFQFSDTCTAYCGSECADLESSEPDFSEKTYHKECRSLQKTSPGQHGIKGALYRVWQKFIRMLKYAICFFYREVVCNTLQWILAGAIVAALFWVYGRQLILTYGYRASDIPVHLNWINQMSRGNLFVSGVYPFGFHCVVYYLHTVFRVDTYVILCLFYLVQVFFIHVVLLAMLKMLCRSLYFPYAGVLVYILGSFWARQTYSRFGASLPQEFGMIFVIPSIYFLIRFFQTEKENLKTKETKLTLGCFAIAFSLTLAIHFYGTMIAGLCCIGIAVGYVFRFLNKEYFRRIMMTGIISVFLAVLPMAIAFAGGTPLQGSLGWGLSVINGGNSDTQQEEKNIDIQNMTIEEIAASLNGDTESTGNTGNAGNAAVQSQTNTPVITEAPNPSLSEKVGEILEKIKNVWNMMAQ